MTDSLSKTFQTYAPWETFMLDGGQHFDNREVRELWDKWGTKTHIMAAYSPWVNGLVEGTTNKFFLHILKHLCAPDPVTWITKTTEEQHRKKYPSTGQIISKTP